MSEATAQSADRVIWGRALRALRLRRGVTIEAAANAYEPEGFTAGDPDKGISLQRWHQIEKGGIKFTQEQRRRLVQAIGADLESLELERARILGARPRIAAQVGMGERPSEALVIPIWGRADLDDDGWKVKDAGRSQSSFDLRDLLNPSIGVTLIADESMKGKAGPGAPVIFDRARRPTDGGGCVVETRAGELYPRIYAGMDAEHVYVRSMVSSTPTAFPRAEVKGVYAVKFWGE